ncbi:8071_t:CDS:1, partial [Cetraspora pellucida]
MLPKHHNSSLKASNSNSSLKKKHTEAYKHYIENHVYNNRIITSFLMKVDKSDARFFVFVKITSIPNEPNKKNHKKYAKWQLVNIKAIFSYKLDETKERK